MNMKGSDELYGKLDINEEMMVECGIRVDHCNPPPRATSEVHLHCGPPPAAQFEILVQASLAGGPGEMKMGTTSPPTRDGFLMSAA